MSLTNFPNGVSSFGMPVLGQGDLFTTGSVFFVSSVTGSNDDNGETPVNALADINAAVAKCTANKKDIIIVMPGHVESLAAAENIDLDVAGISVIGIGNGPDRPRIDYDAVDAVMTIGANGVTVRNITYRPSLALFVVGITIDTTIVNTRLIDVEALDGEAGDGTDEFVDFIVLAVACDRTVIDGLKYRVHASNNGAQTAISIVGASDDIAIQNFDIDIVGSSVEAGIEGITTLSTRLRIANGIIVTDNEPGVTLVSNSTGVISNVYIFSDLASIDAATVADKLAHFEVYYVELGNEAGALVKTESIDD